jgi:hypothetical protein
MTSADLGTTAWTCSDCGKARVFQIIHVHDRFERNAEFPEEFTYAVCNSCSSPLVLSRDDYGGGFDEDAYGQLYPPRKRLISYGVPHRVRGSYDEAVRCEEAGAWTAVGAMVGRALEAVCKDFDPNVTTIDGGLRTMLANGVISQELYDWSNGLRVVRNASAHASTERTTAEDARTALDFLQALLSILYDLRVRFEEWQDARAKRAAKSTAKPSRPKPPAA